MRMSIPLQSDSGRTVLYINDDEKSDQDVKGILEGKGYRVLLTKSSSDAIRILKSEGVHLILYNINLALRDGVEDLMAIKNLCPDIPVIPSCPTHQ